MIIHNRSMKHYSDRELLMLSSLVSRACRLRFNRSTRSDLPTERVTMIEDINRYKAELRLKVTTFKNHHDLVNWGVKRTTNWLLKG